MCNPALAGIRYWHFDGFTDIFIFRAEEAHGFVYIEISRANIQFQNGHGLAV